MILPVNEAKATIALALSPSLSGVVAMLVAEVA